MYRFLTQPRWIAGHVLVIVAVVTFVNLGFWQLRRLDERRTDNARAAERLAQPARPLDELASDGTDPTALDLRPVEVTGSYDADAQLLTAPRAVDGRPAQRVLAVLTRDGGPDVLVDRGWIPFSRDTDRAPAASAGTVRISGVVRAPESGDIGDVAAVAQIVPAQIATRLGRPLAPYYVQLRAQDPTPAADAPRPTPLPERSEGSHLSYAVQWFSFAVVVLVGYPVLVRRTARGRDAGDTAVPTERPRDVTVTSSGRG